MTDLEKQIEWLQTHRAMIKADLDAVMAEIARLQQENEEMRDTLHRLRVVLMAQIDQWRFQGLLEYAYDLEKLLARKWPIDEEKA